MENNKKVFYKAILSIKEKFDDVDELFLMERAEFDDVIFYATEGSLLFVFAHNTHAYSLIYDKEIVALSKVSGFNHWLGKNVSLGTKYLYGSYQNDVLFADICSLMEAEMNEDLCLITTYDFDIDLSMTLVDRVLPAAEIIKEKVVELKEMN